MIVRHVVRVQLLAVAAAMHFVIPVALAQVEDSAAARREFAEELGVQLEGSMLPLGEIRQKAGKRVVAFAVEGELDPTAIRSNSFDIEWPPRSGRRQAFPEIDRAGWFDLETAREKVIPGQVPFLDRLESLCRGGDAHSS